MALPAIRLTGYAGLFDNLPAPVASRKPLCFEDLGQGYGYVLYRTVADVAGSGWLRLKQLRDYAIVYVNGRRQGELDRRLRQDSIWLDGVPGGAVLDILVENNGGGINTNAGTGYTGTTGGSPGRRKIPPGFLRWPFGPA